MASLNAKVKKILKKRLLEENGIIVFEEPPENEQTAYCG